MPRPTDTPNFSPAVAGVDEPMTAGQSMRLKQLAQDAYELEAYSPDLTESEARRRIEMLEAKLDLLSEPPHTI